MGSVHKETQHAGDLKTRRKFACTYGNCKKRFTSKAYLNKHVAAHNVIKTKKPKLKCPHCDYETYKQQQLIAHNRIHTGEKPFACNGQCTHANRNKRFRTQSLLNDHCRHRIAPYNAE